MTNFHGDAPMAPIEAPGGAIQARVVNGQPLNDLAYSKLISALEGFNNRISQTHSRALRDMLGGLTSQALHEKPGRFAYALPCGGGKTQGVVAWVAAAHELGLGLTVAIAASHVLALCLIRRDLVRAGVPLEAVGLRHSKSVAQLRAEAVRAGVDGLTDDLLADSGDADTPIILVTHSRIKGARTLPAFCTHKGRKRDLLIWDETLLTSETSTLSLEALRANAWRFKRDGSALSSWLAACLSTVEAEKCAQESRQAPSILDLAAGFDLEAVSAELSRRGVPSGPGRQIAVRETRALLAQAQRPLSLALTGSGDTGDGLIHYAVVVDPELTNIAVLDASHAIRLLGRAGGVIDASTPSMRSFKRYDRVQIRQVVMPASRSTIKADSKAKAALHDAVSSVLDGVPTGERTVVFTAKDTRDGLLAGLRARGHDIPSAPERGAAISVLTWGNETSLNSFADCRHVVLAGILRRNKLDLAASFAGERDDPRHRHDPRELERSEMAHCVLQAMHRGACRLVDARGLAGQMTLTIIDSEKRLRETLDAELPGAVWDTMTHEQTATKTGAVAAAIRLYLDARPASVNCVAIRSLKAAVGGGALGRDAWRRALEDATSGGFGGWWKLGHELVRWQMGGVVPKEIPIEGTPPFSSSPATQADERSHKATQPSTQLPAVGGQ